MRCSKLALNCALLLVTVAAYPIVALATPFTANNTPGGIMANNVGTNIKLWLRGDAVAQADNTPVISWTDSGPHNYNATGTLGNVPTFDTGTIGVLNGQPTLQFAHVPGTSNSFLTNTTLLTVGAGHFTANENATSFTLYRNPAFPANDHLGIETTGSSPDGAVDLYQGSGSYNGDFRSARIPGAVVGYPSTGAHIKTVVSRDSNDSWQLYSDGRHRLTAAQTWGLHTTYNIGRSVTHAASSFTGQVGETVIYNAALNRAQQVIIENYLSSKYDVAIDGGGPATGLDRYAGDLNANGDYDFEVIGIGQIDATNVHLNSGSNGFGFEAISLDDGDWLLAGHDGTAHGIVAIEGLDSEAQEPTIGERWERVYYLDKTGALDATLGFDFDDAVLTAGDPGSTYALLYSADDDFSDGWEFLGTTTTISAGLVQFSLTDGQLLDGYYTLALNFVQVPEPGTLAMLTLGSLALVYRRRRLAAA